ncbi:MAG: 4Fe-4S binding protein [Desulfobacterales bacterium]|nr:4Fe-4S binding protein [Desulfobacterales bacterium]
MKKYHLTEKRTLPNMVDYSWLREITLEAGADDVGFVEIDREELNDQRTDILKAFPTTKSLISYVCHLNRPQLQSCDRSLADVEFVAIEFEMKKISRTIVKALRKNGIGAVVPSENFPMDMLKWPGKMWTVSHKPVAVAAGLGKIGHHRLLIHPVFGNYISIGTMLLDVVISKYNQPIEFNPCIECKLCVSVCPTGAISRSGEFEFFSCLAHTYRDRLGGFLNWTEAIVTSTSMSEYRQKRNDSESMAVWQSLTHGGGYRCGYCMSVCPAGEETIGSYVDDKNWYISSVIKPLQDRSEPVYVINGVDGETSVKKRFPNKSVRLVD